MQLGVSLRQVKQVDAKRSISNEPRLRDRVPLVGCLALASRRVARWFVVGCLYVVAGLSRAERGRETFGIYVAEGRSVLRGHYCAAWPMSHVSWVLQHSLRFTNCIPTEDFAACLQPGLGSCRDEKTWLPCDECRLS